MSCVGTMIGLPSLGAKIWLAHSINTRASACASALNGKWIAIWSPSKSALYAVHANGCNFNARPSVNTGSNAWIPNLCNVGALFNNTGCSFITSSNTPQTSLFARSTFFFAAFIVMPDSALNFFITNGLKSSNAISFGKPHWCNLSSGPTTITERPE